MSHPDYASASFLRQLQVRITSLETPLYDLVEELQTLVDQPHPLYAYASPARVQRIEYRITQLETALAALIGELRSSVDQAPPHVALATRTRVQNVENQLILMETALDGLTMALRTAVTLQTPVSPAPLNPVETIQRDLQSSAVKRRSYDAF